MLATPQSFRLTHVARPSRRDVFHSRSTLATPAKIPLHGVLFAMFAVDVLGAMALAIVGFLIHGGPSRLGMAPLWEYLGAFLVAWGLSSYLHALYSREALSSGLRRLLLSATATWAQTFGLILLVGFSLRLSLDVSRIWFLGWTASSLLWLAAARIVWRGYLSYAVRRGRCLERALVLAGSLDGAARVKRRVERESNHHIRVTDVAMLPGLPGAPTLDWIEEAVRSRDVDRVVVARFSSSMEQTNALLHRLGRVAIDVTLLPDLEGLEAPILHVDRIGSLPAVDLDFHPLSPVQTATKRIEDLVLAGILLLLVLPLLIVVSIAIRLDSPGPVFFRQVRLGFNNQPFRVWKFRTMYAHARDDNAVQQTSRNDSRVTRIGRFLRRSSIDELPQLFNVIAGDMSIVGPRPHACGMTAQGRPLHDVVAEYSARHRLKPGITGWAQVNGSRGEVDSDEKLRRRVALDFHYIENWSLALDLWIIFRTAALMVVDNNAY